MTNPKGLAPIVIILIIIGGLALGGGALYVKEKKKTEEIKKQAEELTQNQNQQVATTSDETKDWKTYRNEEYGFEFKWPDYEKFFESPSEGIISNGFDIRFYRHDVSSTQDTRSFSYYFAVIDKNSLLKSSSTLPYVSTSGGCANPNDLSCYSAGDIEDPNFQSGNCYKKAEITDLDRKFLLISVNNMIWEAYYYMCGIGDGEPPKYGFSKNNLFFVIGGSLQDLRSIGMEKYYTNIHQVLSTFKFIK